MIIDSLPCSKSGISIYADWEKVVSYWQSEQKNGEKRAEMVRMHIDGPDRT